MTVTRQLAFAAAILCVLAACTSTQPVSRPSADAQRLEQRAEREAERGNLRAAAEAYAELAAGASGPARSGHAIEAARLYIELGDLAAASRLLNDARAGADPTQRQTVTVLLARIELEQGRPQQALDMIAALGRPPAPVLRDAALVRGLAFFRLNRFTDAVGALVERELWLDEADDILANQRLIWDGLGRYRGEAPLPRTGDPIVDGWLALAPLARAPLDREALRRELLTWRETYANHPAARGVLAELLSPPRGAGRYPRQVALLLPLTSPQREAAIAVRDGFLAAHLLSPAAGDGTVRVYDTGRLGAAEAYSRAQLEGAELIVGPLLRPEVEQIVEQAGLVPTLALNFAEQQPPYAGSFYQFALYPEDEARAVARHAYAAGARTAIAFVASTEFGYRLLNSFRDEFEQLGGRLLDFSGYDPGVQDFEAPITSLLHITRSRQRYQRLQANLRVPLDFEPRRRQDVDMIFIGADDARTARLIVPQLRFHFAGDIPTYATSTVYEPGDPARDNDLNGLIFTDAPWLLRQDGVDDPLRRELARHWPRRAQSWLLRFYGMGIDAYRLAESLYDPSRAIWPMQGVSGLLVLDDGGRIHRELPLGQFRAGRPVAIAAPTPLDAEAAAEELASSRPR
ncbi:MAG TPA: penicillin-binding protein activator [Gammaproteobacteria bacterium]